VSQTLLTALTDEPELLIAAVPSTIDVARRVMACVADERPSVSRPAREARETLRITPPWSDDGAVRSIVG